MNASDIVQDELYRHLSPLKGEFERKDAKGLAPMAGGVFQRGLQIRVQHRPFFGGGKSTSESNFRFVARHISIWTFFYLTTLELE